MELMKVENGKVTSLELVKEINFFRSKEENKSELLHKNLLAVIRDEFSEEISELEIKPTFYTDLQYKNRSMYELTINQAKQVLVRESKLVRKAVIKRLDELENLVPQLSEMEMIAKIANNSIEQDKRISAIEYKFENILTIDSGKQRKLQLGINRRVMERFELGSNYGGLGFSKDELVRFKRKLFSAIHRELKNKFGVSSYKDAKDSEFEIALNFVENWIENADVRELV